MISNNGYVESDESINVKDSTILLSIKNFFSLKNIIFILLCIAMSNISFVGEKSSYIFILFAVANIFNVPLILVLLSSIGGLAIFNNFNINNIILIVGFFVIFTLITAVINVEGVSKKISVFIKLLVSTLIVELISNFLASTLVTNILGIVVSMIVVSIFYFIFVNGIYVFNNFLKGYVFSIEEKVSMIVILSMIATLLNNVTIFNLSIFYILIFAILLIFGYKSGWAAGSCAGVSVGLILAILCNINIIYVVIFGFTGLIAGLLKNTGKIGVIIGFLIGSTYILYCTSGFNDIALRVSEFMIASISLLFMPKQLEIQIDKLFNKNNSLEKSYDNMLDVASNVKNKVGAISDVFDSLSEIVLEDSIEDKKETREVIKQYIINYFTNTCIGCDNIDKCNNNERLELTVDYIVSKLENNEKIDINMLDIKCNINQNIIDDIYEIYNSIKLMRIIKQKETENSKKLSKQYEEVSKLLTNIVNNINDNSITVTKKHDQLRDELKFHGYLVYEDDYNEESGNIEYTFITDILSNIDKQKKEIISICSDILGQNMVIKLILNITKSEKSKIKLVSVPDYNVNVNIINVPKRDETISGDSYLSYELDDLKHISVISDGEGNGKSAAKASTTVLNMLEKLLNGGFSESKAIDIINSVIKLKSENSNFSTLDAVIVNLKTAIAQFIKLGSAPTYILSEDKVVTINNITLPVGILKDSQYLPIERKLRPNDIIIQVSDGVIPDKLDYNNNYFIDAIKKIDNNKSVKAISEELYKAVLKNYKDQLADDVTIIVTKFNKNKK